MRSSILSVTLVLLIGPLGNLCGASTSIHPLAPPDRSSPRATLKTFLDNMNKAVEAYKGKRRAEAKEFVTVAAQCLDLEKEPPALRLLVGLDSSLYLKEVLDRIQLPRDEDIPDAPTVQAEKIAYWTIPYTEITFAVEKEGSAGLFRFTSDTVGRAEEFYDKVKSLPYLPGTGGGASFERFSSSAGAIVPPGIIENLPGWARIEIYSQAAWQWIGLAIYCLVGIATIALARRYVGAMLAFIDTKSSWNLRYYVGGLVIPIALVIFAKAGMRVTVFGLHIINANAYLPVAYALMSLSYLGTIWLIGAILNRISSIVIAMGGAVREQMDVQLIRLGFEIMTIFFVVLATIHLSSRLGLPTYSLVTGLGIGGLAVALAGREALSNLIGTVMIILDRPFKIGDYIVLSEGERGVVAEVGFRSTRIRTRDDVLISIPNSVMANTKMINESAPRSSFRIRVKVGVAYGSDLRQVERLLMDIADQNEAVLADPTPGLDFEALEIRLSTSNCCAGSIPPSSRVRYYISSTALFTMSSGNRELRYLSRNGMFICVSIRNLTGGELSHNITTPVIELFSEQLYTACRCFAELARDFNRLSVTSPNLASTGSVTATSSVYCENSVANGSKRSILYRLITGSRSLKALE